MSETRESKYSAEFKAEAIIILKHFDGDVDETARLLDMDPQILRGWYNAYIQKQNDTHQQRSNQRKDDSMAS